MNFRGVEGQNHPSASQRLTILCDALRYLVNNEGLLPYIAPLQSGEEAWGWIIGGSLSRYVSIAVAAPPHHTGVIILTKLKFSTAASIHQGSGICEGLLGPLPEINLRRTVQDNIHDPRLVHSFLLPSVIRPVRFPFYKLVPLCPAQGSLRGFTLLVLLISG